MDSSPLSDILNGYSFLNWDGNKIFVKHFNPLDTALFDSKREEFFIKAKGDGLLTLKEKESLMIENGLWTEKQEKDIKELEGFIKTLNKTKEKQILQKNIDIYNKQIKDENEKLSKLRTEKDEIIGLTAESFADRELSDLYIFKALYQDSSFTSPFFAHDEFDYFEKDILVQLISKYNEVVSRFSDNILKKISISPQFYNLFVVSEGDVFKFYGKPIINLSFYQIDIFRHAQFFKKLFSNSQTTPPEDIMDDPDRLVEWYNSSQNMRNIVEKETNDPSKVSAGKVVAVVGAQAKDYKRAGIVQNESNVLDLNKEMQRLGKTSLEMEDLVKLGF